MKEEKKESPIGILWGWGKPYHGKFIGSIALAVLGVACQMVPYFCVAHIVTLMLSGDQNFSHYTAACVIALCGYLGKVIFSNLSTTISHTATYYTLRDLRENITAKLAPSLLPGQQSSFYTGRTEYLKSSPSGRGPALR